MPKGYRLSSGSLISLLIHPQIRLYILPFQSLCHVASVGEPWQILIQIESLLRILLKNLNRSFWCLEAV